MAAFTFLAVKRQNREKHAKLSLMLLSQAEKKHIDKQFKDWERES